MRPLRVPMQAACVRTGDSGTAPRGIGPGLLRFQFLPCAGGSHEESHGYRWNLLQGQDPDALRKWYQRHLGIDVQNWGGAAFRWTDAEGKPAAGTTIWTVSDAGGDYFARSASPRFMVNYRVADLHALIRELRAEGCNVLDKVEDSEYGKFGWVIDPEGNGPSFGNRPPASQRAPRRSGEVAALSGRSNQPPSIVTLRPRADPGSLFATFKEDGPCSHSRDA